MNEEWRFVKETGNAYQVSNLGNVRSVDRVKTFKNGRTQAYKGKLLKPKKMPNGYVQAFLGRDYGFVYIHRLVAQVFIGEIPDGMFVLHWNDIKDDNRPENLRFGNNKDNAKDAIRNLRYADGESHYCAKFSAAKIKEAKSLEGKMNAREASETLGISKRHVRGIWSGTDRRNH